MVGRAWISKSLTTSSDAGSQMRDDMNIKKKKKKKY